MLVTVVVLFALACRRSTLIPPPPKLNDSLTATLVENASCSYYVVKLLSGPTSDSSVVVKSWTDPVTHSTFTNVFTVKDWIQFQQANISVGDTFTFTLNGPVPDSTQAYYTCMIVPYNMPSVYNNVTNIQLVK